LRFSLRRAPRDIPCIEFVELVTDYLEGALPARAREAFEHHLTRCDGCTAYLAQIRETRRISGALAIEDVPAAGIKDLMAAFRAYQTERADEPGGPL
jgi:anti-sigma factor RsiW